MKSASEAASSRGQTQVQESATYVEAETPTEVSMEIDDGKEGALPSANGTENETQNRRESIFNRSSTDNSAVEITTQQGVDGYRE